MPFLINWGEIFFLSFQVVALSAFVPVHFDLTTNVRLTSVKSSAQNPFLDAEVVKISLEEHKPLGCTVEEGLGNDLKPVFVSKIIEGGNAEKGGLQVGDVIIEISGMFEGMEKVLGKGIGAVTSAVSGKSEGEVLNLVVARGTNVVSDHESALVDICTSIGQNEQEIEECVVDYLTTTYEEEMKLASETLKKESNLEDKEYDEDKLLNNILENMWGDELEEMLPTNTTDISEDVAEKESPKKVAPWRSRSSPSGTFVRDPSTGQMINIDD
mmetsp:Transcript_20666/g.31073  ORF Transcript_20666/g.31073 Transcript_20666/m.31073 type:complete len:270 (-) Transcript_20666:354-1163(-)|eukprot:CAMPEP_0178912056 /NCGR_PEP_ID=MMETSP0786-20121207/10042_1 /TAXON_ID=186022 /ORGANISM="Thalassionema frauenfeldii, Strain CCMP 1798" /LENGTH=269 /DNA_ID=CAMNT_0020584579 /DNA_START=134 /DNA_END=943 /DNA_ORIENTATION=-